MVLPRVLSIHQVKQLARVTPVPLEVFAFGSLCIMSEGRCYLSSYYSFSTIATPVRVLAPAGFRVALLLSKVTLFGILRIMLSPLRGEGVINRRNARIIFIEIIRVKAMGTMSNRRWIQFHLLL